MAKPTRFSQLPIELVSQNMLKHADPGEPIVVAQIYTVGNTAPFRLQGRSNRSIVFVWDRPSGCHIFKCPLSLWQMDKNALAREVTDQRLMHAVVFTVEIQPAVAVPPQPAPESNLPPHQQRVVDEKAALDEKGDKLQAFKGTEIYDGLPVEEKERLCLQLELMGRYSNVLGDRIAAFPVAPIEPKPNPSDTPPTTPYPVNIPEEIMEEDKLTHDDNGDRTVTNIVTETTQEAEPPADDIPTAETIHQIIARLPKTRLAGLAAEMEIDAEVLRKIIEAEGSGIVIKSGNWIALAE